MEKIFIDFFYNENWKIGGPAKLCVSDCTCTGGLDL